MYVDRTRPHLGGYLKGGDPGSWYPALWDWMIAELDITSMIDIGCGEGHSLAYFRSKGVRVVGVEGIEQDDPDIICHDFTTGPLDLGRQVFDLCWCCEFVEHVEEQYSVNFLRLFERASYVAMTHALPGQGGHHHVNCQPAEYWIDLLESRCFRYSKLLTAQAKALTPLGYFDWSGLVFRS